MADERRVIASSLTSFDDAARAAFGTIRGNPGREGSKAAEVSRSWMTGGGFVGIPQYHVELLVLGGADRALAAGSWTCDGWYAYHDFMPGSIPTLHVGATCSAPTNGHVFSLVRAEPQGTNPRDLLLRLEADEPEFANEVQTTYELHYREDTDERFDTVSILPDGPTGIEVQILEKES